jgi:general secretion pathway protein D
MREFFTILFFIFTFSIFGQSIVNKKEPKTIEEYEENKKSVIQKLQALFAPTDPAEIQRLIRPVSPPYVKIIKGSDGRATMIYRVRNAQAKSLVNAMESVISSSATVEYAAEKNLIVINDLDSKMPELQEALESMDLAVPQLLVEAKILEVFLQTGTERDVRVEYQKTDNGDGNTSTMGLNLTAPAQNIQPDQGTGFNFYPYSSGTTAGRILKNLNLYIRWLQNTRDAKILSAPNIIVDLGSTASIITGEDLPIQETQVTGNSVTTSTRYKRIGVKLNVTPMLINNDLVQLKVNPEVTSVIRYEQFTQNDLTFSTPVIAIRNISTELSMVDGEIIMLGGLYSTEKLTTKRRTPYLSDLPILGELFTALDESDVQKQLIFFLKMHVIIPGKTDAMVYQDLEKISDDIQKASVIIERSKTIFPLNKLPQRQKLFKSIDAASKITEKLNDTSKDLEEFTGDGEIKTEE